jgi:hypothetical protein
VLENKTDIQRLVIAMGMLAGALLAIGAVVTAAIQLVDGNDETRLSADPPAGVVGVENQSSDADQLVRDLIDHEGTVVELNHQIMGEPGPGNVTVDYACDETAGCSTVGIEDGQTTFEPIVGGVWFKGCYGVTVDGNGYGAQALELTARGATCPS